MIIFCGPVLAGVGGDFDHMVDLFYPTKKLDPSVCCSLFSHSSVSDSDCSLSLFTDSVSEYSLSSASSSAAHCSASAGNHLALDADIICCINIK